MAMVQDDPIAHYDRAHRELAKVRGKASGYVCLCGRQARHWAFNNATPAEHVRWTNNAPPRPFSDDVRDYDALCPSCHRLADDAARYV